MADIIQLLPETIANQIAAGEVVQRPASIVKELMENAIDAGATSIKVIIKDAGKALVQVIDNGCGMSETDARLSLERHATSKIRQASDLFAIRTMGFRGEALASIAAVAQLEMRTRLHDEELGSRLQIEGGEVQNQEPCQCTAGTNISVKNLFFNTPARRNFLKSNNVEMRHITEEFQRIALAYPDLFFSLHHNKNELYHLPAGNLRQRIVGLLSGNANKKLVPVQEATQALQVQGFVGKPEFAKKTRGDQFFFVNQRNIKSGYLHHAVVSAYEDMLPKDTQPLYVLFLTIDPNRIDVNVHPTKQEIKFEDEKLVYDILKVSVRHALGKIRPTIDFESDAALTPYPTLVNPGSGGHTRKGGMRSGSGDSGFRKPSQPNIDWQKLYEGLDEEVPDESETGPIHFEHGDTLTLSSRASAGEEFDDEEKTFSVTQKAPYQIHASYIVSHIKSGFMLVDQQSAHERILYEKYLNAIQNQESFSQKELFARTVELSPADAEQLSQVLEEINQLGFDIKPFGQHAFVIHGMPADLGGTGDIQKVIESLLEQYKQNVELGLDSSENMARSMARSASIKRGQILNVQEMQELIDQLFACQIPHLNPTGKKCFIVYELDELNRNFGV